MYNAPEQIDVLLNDSFTIIARAGTLGRCAQVLAKYPKIATRISDTVQTANYQGQRCYSALYKVKGYPYKIIAWFAYRDGHRIA